jgi:hypothetical protein
MIMPKLVVVTKADWRMPANTRQSYSIHPSNQGEGDAYLSHHAGRFLKSISINLGFWPPVDLARDSSALIWSHGTGWQS